MGTPPRVVRASRSHVLIGCLLAVATMIATAHARVTFDLQSDSSLSAQAVAGLELAAQRWSNVLLDPVTVSLQVTTHPSPSAFIAVTDLSLLSFAYRDYRSALGRDRQSAADRQAHSSIPSSDYIPLLINRTADSPHGRGSPVPYLDANQSKNNELIIIPTANARALGLLPARDGLFDARISFNRDQDFDYDPSDGIAADQFDFVGIATHEIGHALGFYSGIEVLDHYSRPTTGPHPEDAFPFVTPLDLLRYSEASRSYGQGVIDWTADGREKYLSIDGGNSRMPLSTGSFFGNGYDTSHWQYGAGLGVMDPTVARGASLAISMHDLTALDVIGYDIAIAPVPEPATTAAAGALLLVVAIVIRSRRRKGTSPAPLKADES